MNVQFLHVPCIMYIVHALKVVLEDVCTNQMCQTPVLFQRLNRKECFSMVKHQQNVTYRLPFFKLFCVLPKNVVQTSILMMINVFVFRVIARVSRFIISIGILDLQLQEIYGMSALCTRSDSVESGHTSDGGPMFERRRLAVY